MNIVLWASVGLLLVAGLFYLIRKVRYKLRLFWSDIQVSFDMSSYRWRLEKIEQSVAEMESHLRKIEENTRK